MGFYVRSQNRISLRVFTNMSLAQRRALDYEVFDRLLSEAEETYRLSIYPSEWPTAESTNQYQFFLQLWLREYDITLNEFRPYTGDIIDTLDTLAFSNMFNEEEVRSLLEDLESFVIADGSL